MDDVGNSKHHRAGKSSNRHKNSLWMQQDLFQRINFDGVEVDVNYFKAVLNPDTPNQIAILRPQLTYSEILYDIIMASPNRRISTNQIYAYVVNKYPYFKYSTARWRNSVNSVLSRSPMFKSITVHNSKGLPDRLWTINEGGVSSKAKNSIKTKNQTSDKQKGVFSKIPVSAYQLIYNQNIQFPYTEAKIAEPFNCENTASPRNSESTLSEDNISETNLSDNIIGEKKDDYSSSTCTYNNSRNFNSGSNSESCSNIREPSLMSNMNPYFLHSIGDMKMNNMQYLTIPNNNMCITNENLCPPQFAINPYYNFEHSQLLMHEYNQRVLQPLNVQNQLTHNNQINQEKIGNCYFPPILHHGTNLAEHPTALPSFGINNIGYNKIDDCTAQTFANAFPQNHIFDR